MSNNRNDERAEFDFDRYAEWRELECRKTNTHSFTRTNTKTVQIPPTAVGLNPLQN